MARAAFLPSAANQAVWVCDTPTVTPVPASTSTVTLMEPDDARSHGQVYNDSTAVLFVKWGDGASSSSFTTKVPPQALYELPRITPYVGRVTGAWASQAGKALVTVAF